VVVSLPAGVTATAIAAGGNHSLAIGSNGNVYAWGFNYEGQLGNGIDSQNSTTPQSKVPVLVKLPAGVTARAIAAGENHSLAIGSDGKLYAWGWNNFGQLGIGSTDTDRPTPVVVTLSAGVTPTAITAGSLHSLATGSDGNLYAWGSNDSGELATETRRPAPSR